MQSKSYYVEQADKAERLASLLNNPAAKAELLRMAEDYRDIAADLENGSIEVRHPELMRQLDHPR